MGRTRENPRYNVVSTRIREKDHEYLERVSTKTNKSISEIMREAIKSFATSRPLE